MIAKIAVSAKVAVLKGSNYPITKLLNYQILCAVP